MVSQRYKKRIAWVLVAALLNLVFVGVPGSGAVFAASHGGGKMQGLRMAAQSQPACHTELSHQMPAMDRVLVDDYCPDCEEGCTLCFQIPAAMPAMGVVIGWMPDAFADSGILRLTGISQAPASPPPRSLFG